jgi:hypothetical protein
MSIPMKIRLVAGLIMVVTATISQAFVPQKAFDRQQYYSTLQGDNLDKINIELNRLSKSSFSEKPAFEGAMLMKKAGVIGGAIKKLRLFKQGGRQLDAEIDQHPYNGEYRFLRLIIQEHAPGIVNYDDNIDADKKLIVSSYKKFPSELQKVISTYSNSSKALDPKDF